MLKRKGQATIVAGLIVPLTHGELNSYTAAFMAIRPEFDEMVQMRQQVRRLPLSILKRAAKLSDTATAITVEGIEWQIQTQLLKLPKSEIYLCRHPTEDESAIIQQFPPKSAYAKANGQSEILLRGVDPRQLLHEYEGQAQHTLRFMASNLVAKAQRVAFEQFPKHNPGQVVRAISQHCRRIIGESIAVAESAGQTRRQGPGIRT